MIKGSYSLSLIFVLLVLIASSYASYAQETIDKNLRNLSWTGKLRTRLWHINANSATDTSFVKNPLQPEVKQQETYQDLFFRNRFNLKISQYIDIKTVFDIGTIKLGDATGSSLGNAPSTIQATNIYLRFKAIKGGVIDVGMQPFSFPGGHILAKDGAGLKYRQRLLQGRLLAYILYIKALEQSHKDIEGNITSPIDNRIDNDSNDTDIFGFGNQVSLFHNDLNLHFYYVYLLDNSQYNTTLKSTFPNALNWIGLNSKYVHNKFIFSFATIVNWGILRPDAITTLSDPPKRVNIAAALFSFTVGYRLADHLTISLITEGATGDPKDENAADSFQAIQPSHDLTNIMVDNTGGIAIRSGGKLYGLYAGGFNIDYVLFGSLSLSLKWLHFRSTRVYSGTLFSRTNIGDEFNFSSKYLLYEKISFFLEASIFLPGKAYTSYINHIYQRPIVEVMLGAQVNY